jgi:hypothetical protein
MLALFVNPIAVVVGVVIAMAVGFLWYSPMLFAKPWMALIGKTEEQLGSPGPAYAITIVAAAVTAYVLGVFVNLAPPKSPANGALVGLVAAVGFIATAFGTMYVFEGRPSKLYLINVGYQVVTLVLMGLAHGLIP